MLQEKEGVASIPFLLTLKSSCSVISESFKKPQYNIKTSHSSPKDNRITRSLIKKERLIGELPWETKCFRPDSFIM